MNHRSEDTKSPIERHFDRIYRSLLDVTRGSVSADAWPALLSLMALRFLADFQDDTRDAFLREPSNPPIAERIDAIAVQVEQRIPMLQRVFGETLLAPLRRFPAGILVDFFFTLSQFSPAVMPDDRVIFGSWFDEQVNKSMMRSGQSGASATPPSIARLIVQIAEMPADSHVLDPYCGVGTVLAQAAKSGRSLRLFGEEINQDSWAIAKLRLFLLEQDVDNIVLGDSLEQPAFLQENGELTKFDCVLCDAPIGMLPSSPRYESMWHQFPFGQPGRGPMDNAFVQRALQSMKSTGRAVALVSHGFLFRSGADARIREALLEAGYVNSVIGLPAKLRTESAIETALIVFGPKTTAKEVLFVDASVLQPPVRGRTELSDDVIETIVALHRDRQSRATMAKLVSPNEIRANDFSLLPRRYIAETASAPLSRRDLRQLHADIKALEVEHNEAIDEMDELLDEYLGPTAAERRASRKFRLGS